MTVSAQPEPDSAADETSGRRARTRQALISAGLELLAAQPVEAIPIDDIVRVAGVAKGSFFNHFRDKEAFAAAIARQLRAEIEAAVGETNRGVDDAARRVARAVCVYIGFAARDPKRASVLLHVTPRLAEVGTPLNHGVFDDISDGLLGGRFAVPTAEAGVLLVLGVAQIALATVLREPSPGQAAALGQQLCSLLLRGLGLAAAEADQIAAQAAHELIGRAA